MNNFEVSVIIPTYNESKDIENCLKSIICQSLQNFEIIIVDDGSTDGTPELVNKIVEKENLLNLKVIMQPHLGPGNARNKGVEKAVGKIVVFVDADMVLEREYVKHLVEPIINSNIKGTFTKEEYVQNWKNVWARCWNYNEGIPGKRRILESYPNTSPVFRAILVSEFRSVGGYDDIGFTDDWTLSRKLGYKAQAASGAICYHHNPETIPEVYRQARWIGKNEFISGTFIRKLLNFVRFNPLTQLLRGILIAAKYHESEYIIFSLIYSSGVTISILNSFFGEHKNK